MSGAAIVIRALIILGLVVAQVFSPPNASEAAETNFVFQAQSSLRAATLGSSGGRPVLELLNSRDLDELLLDGAPNVVLALAVEELDCDPLGPRPAVKLVSYNPVSQQIVDTFVVFDEHTPVYIGQSAMLMHSPGSAGDAIISEDLGALISLQYTPCNPPNPTTGPTQVELTPLGWIKPHGPPPAFAPTSRDTGTLTVVSDDPESRTNTISLTGTAVPAGLCNYTVSPLSLSFGQVQVGGSNVLFVTIRNSGAVACPIYSISRTGSPAFRPGISLSAPTNLAAGASLSVPVIFEPSAAGSVTGTVRIASADPIEPLLQVALSGSGVIDPTPVCDIEILPPSLSFGEVEVGSASNLTITVSNKTSSVACAIESIRLIGGSDFALLTSQTNNVNLGPNASLAVPVEFAPSISGPNQASVRIRTTDADQPLVVVPVSGTGVVSACNLNVDSLTLDFGSVQIGTNKVLSVTVTNSGPADCGVNNILVLSETLDFNLVDPSLTNFVVASGSAVEVEVDYTPSVATNVTGSMLINTEDPARRLIRVNLQGRGLTPVCSMSVSNQDTDFGFVAVGFSRTNTVATITNTGLASGAITNITVDNATEFFVLEPPLPVTLAPFQSTNVVVEYVPTGFGADNTTVRIFDDCPGSVRTVAVTAFGVLSSPGCAISVTNLIDFGVVGVGSTNTIKARFSNTGTTNCLVSLIRFTPCDGTTDFTTVVPATPFTLVPNAFGEVAVTYRPSAAGGDCGTLEIFSDDPLGPVSIVVTGSAGRCEIALSPASLDFGDVLVGATNELSFILSNISSASLACRINSVSPTGSGDFRLDPGVPTGGFVLAAGGAVEIPVLYIPSNAGEDNGSIQIVSEAGTTNVVLSGTGVKCTIEVPASLDFGEVTIGKTNTLTARLSNTGSAACSVSILTNAIGNAAFRVTPPFAFPVPAGTNVVIEVQYVPVDAQTILILGGQIRGSGRPTMVIEP